MGSHYDCRTARHSPAPTMRAIFYNDTASSIRWHDEMRAHEDVTKQPVASGFVLSPNSELDVRISESADVVHNSSFAFFHFLSRRVLRAHTAMHHSDLGIL